MPNQTHKNKPPVDDQQPTEQMSLDVEADDQEAGENAAATPPDQVEEDSQKTAPVAPPAESPAPRRPSPAQEKVGTCPQCSTKKKPVYLVAKSSRQFFTWYGCPNAPEKCDQPNVKLARRDALQVDQIRRRYDEGFSSRECL